MQSLWQFVGSKYIASNSDHPQLVGQTDKTHTALKKIIRAHILESGDKTMWVSSLPFIEFLINSITSDSTDKSPFELVLGAIMAAQVYRLDGFHHIKSL